MSDLGADVVEMTGWTWDQYWKQPSWAVEKLIARHNEKARESEAQAEARRTAARTRRR